MIPILQMLKRREREAYAQLQDIKRLTGDPVALAQVTAAWSEIKSALAEAEMLLELENDTGQK